MWELFGWLATLYSFAFVFLVVWGPFLLVGGNIDGRPGLGIVLLGLVLALAVSGFLNHAWIFIGPCCGISDGHLDW